MEEIQPRRRMKPVERGAATTSTGAEEGVVVVAATVGLEISRRMGSDRLSEAALVGVSALLFAGSTTLTIVWCASMPAMGGMSMPGGWTMSMAWMRMPGQTWPGAAVSFLGMWVVMMVAMMPWPPLQSVLCRSDCDPPGPRGHGSSRDGGRDGSHHRRTTRTGR